VNIKIRVCQIIGPAAAGSAGPVPTALPNLIEIKFGTVDWLRPRGDALCQILCIKLSSINVH